MDTLLAALLGHRVQERQLVLPPVRADDVDPPDLLRARLVAERLEGHGRFDRPAPVEAAGGDVPDRVEVAVVGAVVERLAVAPSADRVDDELESVAPVVERVQVEHHHVVTAPDGGMVAAHLFRDDPVHPAFPERNAT